MRIFNTVFLFLALAGAAFSYPHDEYKREAKSAALHCDDQVMTYRDSLAFTHAFKTVTGCQIRDYATQGVDSLRVLGGMTVHGRTADSLAVLDSALTGYATKPTDTLRCAVDIFHVDLNLVAGITGTSNDTVFTFGHAPAACRPSHTLTFFAAVTNNGVQRISKVTLAPTGIFTVYKTDTAGVMSALGFTASGTKAIGAGTVFSFSRF